MRTLVKLATVSLLLVSLLPVTPSTAQDAFVVIVHPGNPTTSLSKGNLSKMFLKQKTSWGHGPAVTPVDHPVKSPVRRAFSSSVLGRSAPSIKAYWSQQIFSGRGVPPAQKRSDAAVVAHVLRKAGGIGYVKPGASGSAKVIKLR